MIYIITGGPGTGKSTMADRLLAYLGGDIVKVSYDDFKEKEWDAFGFDDVGQKKRVNEFALEEFYLTLQKLMWEKRTILIEYPFYQYHRQKLLELVSGYDYHAVTLYLYTDLKTAYERGVLRDDGGGRHPGHLLNRYHIEDFSQDELRSANRKHQSFEEFKNEIRERNYNIEIGYTIKVDVTDFSRVSYEEIFKRIVSIQNPEGSS